MRFYSRDDRRLLAAAKHVARHASGLKLSSVQGVLAKALGYRDLHDFKSQHASHSPSSLDQDLTDLEFRQRWIRIIVEVANSLETDDATIQYHLAQTRLTGDRTWSLDDHLRIRAGCWVAQGIVGPHYKRAGGFAQIIEDNGKRFGEVGYLIKFGKPSSLLGQSGFWNCADFELKPLDTDFEPFVPFSHYIPYGFKRDGAQTTFFGREYFPMWIINESGSIERPNPWDHFHAGSEATWFAQITGEHFLSPRTREMALQSLAEHEISGLPVFANATPAILKDGVTSLSTAVDAMENNAKLPNEHATAA
jgi:hypothetical protein